MTFETNSKKKGGKHMCFFTFVSKNLMQNFSSEYLEKLKSDSNRYSFLIIKPLRTNT